MDKLSFAIAFIKHFGLEGEYQEINPSVQYQHDLFIAGIYLNSENTASIYAGIRTEIENFYVEGGWVTGYSYVNVAPFLRAGWEYNEHASLFIAPAFEAPKTIGLVIGVEFKF